LPDGGVQARPLSRAKRAAVVRGLPARCAATSRLVRSRATSRSPSTSRAVRPAATDTAGTEATQAPAKKSVSKGLTPPKVEEIRQRREGIHDQLEADIHPGIVDFFSKQESKYLDKLTTTFKSLPAQTKGSVQKAAINTLVDPYFDSQPDDHSLAIQLYADLSPSLASGIAGAVLQVQAAGAAAGGVAGGSTGPDSAITFSRGTTVQSKVVDDYLLKKDASEPGHGEVASAAAGSLNLARPTVRQRLRRP